jgi:uncharacterized protein with NAD-binding domain and iron-sulfur cluster
MKSVAIFGGGVAGLTAAHELSPRFQVELFEAGLDLGGRTAGLRIIRPSDKNLLDTLSRIPAGDGGSVADRLRCLSELGVAEPGLPLSRIARQRPEQSQSAFRLVHAVEEFFDGLGARESDLARFAAALLDFMVSCDERRCAEFEARTFWQHIAGERFEPRFQRILAAPRLFGVFDVVEGSARRVGRAVLQRLLNLRRSAGDAVIGGPLQRAWIRRWQDHLAAHRIRFHFAQPLEALKVDPRSKSIARAVAGGEIVSADYYVAALPLHRLRGLISEEIAALDAGLEPLRRPPPAAPTREARPVACAEFELDRQPFTCDGPLILPASPWGLAAIAEPDSTRLSVEISECGTPGSTGRTASECAPEEALDEVWRQLEATLGPGIQAARCAKRALNAPVLHPVQGPRAIDHQPRHFTGLSNLMIAGEQVQASTEAPTMENANEAGRMAANAVFDADGCSRQATLFTRFEETGELVSLARRVDAVRWYGGAAAHFRGLVEQQEALSLSEVKAAQDAYLVEHGLSLEALRLIR